MDWQTAFDIAAGLLGVLGSWILKITYDAQRELRNDLRALQTAIGENYVRRDDFREVTDRLFTTLNRIEDKIDRKADK